MLFLAFKASVAVSYVTPTPLPSCQARDAATGCARERDPLQARPKFSAANERCGEECIHPSVTYHDQGGTFGRRCACSRQVQEAVSGEGKCTLHRCVVLSASLLSLAHVTYPAFLMLRSYSRLARSSGPRDGKGMRIRRECPRTEQCLSAMKCPPIPVRLRIRTQDAQCMPWTRSSMATSPADWLVEGETARFVLYFFVMLVYAARTTTTHPAPLACPRSLVARPARALTRLSRRWMSRANSGPTT